MSIINQVLNQLEQRGVPAVTVQAMVRVVPSARRKTRPWLMIGLSGLVLGLLLALTMWQWILRWQPRGAVNHVMPSKSISVAAPATTENAPVPMQMPALRLSLELGPASLAPLLQPDPAQALLAANKTVTAEVSAPVRSAGKPDPRPQAAKKQTATQAASTVPAIKDINPAPQADAEFRKAVAWMQQGRIADAINGYEEALRLNAGHDKARHALAVLLLEEKRGKDAERILQERLQTHPEHIAFAILLARLLMERDALEQAVATLERSLPHAGSHADYHAFFAALLQRQSRHKEAIVHYQVALQRVPNKGVWLMGYGISLQAVQRNEEARESFNRALDSRNLGTELQVYVRQRLKHL